MYRSIRLTYNGHHRFFFFFFVCTFVWLPSGIGFAWTGVVLFCFLDLEGVVVVLDFCLFVFERELKVGWLEKGEPLKDLGEGKNKIEIYLNLKY